MLPRLIEARHLGGYRIALRWADGSAGELDLTGELWGEMFERLQDGQEFAGFRIDEELGTLVWPNGADLAPEFLYECARR